ncbi:MAG: PAS domain S-box protein [Anaeromyxobacteraceae bacterium]
MGHLIGYALVAGLGAFVGWVAARRLARAPSKSPAQGAGAGAEVSWARYELLAAQAQEAIAFVRADDGRILGANRAASEAYGYTIEELCQRTVRDLRAPGRVSSVERDLAAAGTGVRFETLHRRKDGSIFPVEVSSIGTTAGAERVLVAVVRDLSAQRRTEDQLRASEERLRLLIEHAPAAIAMFDREMRYLAASRRYLADYRLGDVEVLGRSHYALFPEIPERWRDVHRRCLAGATEANEEDPFPRADGRTDWVKWEICPWRDARGEVGGLILFSELVTARVEAEERLAAERERLAVTLESIGDAVIATDREARVTVFNGVAERLTGWTAREALGRPLQDVFRIVSERTGSPVESPVERVLREGAVVGLTNHTSLVARDGRIIPIADSGAPIRDAHGRTIGVVLVFRDQTEERRAARALEESERRYRLLADHANDVIWTLDLSTGRYGYISPSIRTLRGLTVEEALAERIEQSLTPASLARVQAAMATIGTPQELGPLTGIYEQPCKDGTTKHVEITTTVVRDEAGRPVEVVGVSRDATARVKAQAALEESAELYGSLFRLAPSGVILLDEAGRIVTFNDKACQTLGYSREEFARMRVSDFNPREPVPEDVAAHLRRIDQAGFEQFETVHLTKAGEPRTVLVTSRPVVVGGQRRFLAIWQDLTAERQLEEQYRQAQKLESMGRLAGGVAHDFNNLLTVILGCASSLEEAVAAAGPGPTGELREIATAAKRAADLTGQLLAFARKQPVNPVPLDVGEVVRSSEKMLRRLLGEDVELRVECPPDLWATTADPGQLGQVVVNLAVNARDAMPAGGTLVLRTENLTVPPDVRPEDRERVPGEWVRLTVQDTGAGMSADVQAHVFEPFFTTKEVGKGTGLGLAMVYGIVSQAGGHVHVRSEQGQGTTFEVCLPRARAAAPVHPPAGTAGAARGTERVLLVEDDPGVRSVMRRSLQSAGYEVVALSLPAEALALSTEETARFRLLVTDVVMPGMDGRALARALRGRHPGLPVLYVSGYAPDRAGEASPGGEDGAFLPKPFTRADLLEKVRSLIERARPA